MAHLTADVKHHILLECTAESNTRSLDSIAALHDIKGGRATLHSWLSRWDGNAASLEEKPRSGRPPLLSTAQVHRHIQPRVLAANRQHRAIHYTDMLKQVVDATHTKLSLRTLRRYGREELGIKQRKSKKRTHNESEFTHVCEAGAELMRLACALTSRLLLFFSAVVSVM